MKKNILIVDDDKAIRLFLEDFLEEEGYTACFCNDAFEAIKLIQLQKFDVLLTDLGLPGMNGLELIHKAKEIQPGIIILVMTGNATLDSAKQALQEGVYDYIYKPFNTYDIQTAIEHALEKSRLVKENIKFKELVSISRVSDAVTSLTNLESLLKTIINLSINHTNSDRGFLAVLNQEEKRFQIKAVAGMSLGEESQVEYEEEINKIFSSTVHPKDLPILISYNGKTPHPLEEEILLKKWRISSETSRNEERLIIPLKIKNSIVGLISLIKNTELGRFAKGDLEYLFIIANQAAVSIENNKLVRDLKESYLNTIQSLALMIEAKSRYTKGHLEGVSKIALKLGQKLKLSQKELETLIKGSSLHDIGKIGISDDVLNKPDKLTEEEFACIKQHPIIGDEILAPITFLSNIRPIVKHHHERMDGKGYPDELPASQLSLFVRIVMIADACEAMMSNRPYRKGLNPKTIIKELENNAGTQFDPDLVKVLIGIIKYEQKQAS